MVFPDSILILYQTLEAHNELTSPFSQESVPVRVHRGAKNTTPAGGPGLWSDEEHTRKHGNAGGVGPTAKPLGTYEARGRVATMATEVARFGQSTLTPQQMELRRTGIGASEIAAVLGLHHKLTPLDIWMQKRGMAEPQFDNQFLKMGRILEGVIRGLYYEEVARPEGLSMLENVGTQVHQGEQWMLCTPDAVLIDVNTQDDGWRRGLECKNRDAFWRDQFGESGSDVFPDDVAAQCVWSMAVTGLDRWDVAVLLGGNDFRTYTMHRNQDLIDAMVEQAREFWFTNVVGGKEPPIVGRSAKEYLKKRFALHTSDLIESNPQLDTYLAGYADAKKQAKEWEIAVHNYEAALCTEVGANAGIRSRLGTFTWKSTRSGGTDWQALARDYAPADAITSPSYQRPGFRKIHWSPAKV